jgi:hypothetical protein
MRKTLEQMVEDNTRERANYYANHPEDNWKTNIPPERLKKMEKYMKVK